MPRSSFGLVAGYSGTTLSNASLFISSRRINFARIASASAPIAVDGRASAEESTRTDGQLILPAASSASSHGLALRSATLARPSVRRIIEEAGVAREAAN